MSLYVTTHEINDLKIRIIRFANDWARRKKTPVPQKEIIANMEAQGENGYTVINALVVLLRKGYLSRTKIYGEGSKTFYKILRTV